MSDIIKTAKIETFKPKPGPLMTTIRRLAQDTGNIIWSDHALDQIDERDMSTLDALRVIRLGEIEGDIESGENAGEWKCMVTFKQKGSREVGVVTIVAEQRLLIIKTVMWVDE